MNGQPDATEVSGDLGLSVEIRAALDLRYSFTAQFFRAAAYQSREAFWIESRCTSVDLSEETAHRGFVVGSVMQAVAGLEAEIAEIVEHGPGHQLGSSGINHASRDFLRPLMAEIDSQPVLKRYNAVLHLLRKETLAPGEEPWQSAAWVVKLRNYVVHCRSRWESETDDVRLLEALSRKGFPAPPFYPTGSSLFPHRLLSGACAAWAVDSCVAFMGAFYDRLGVESPLDPHISMIDPRLPEDHA